MIQMYVGSIYTLKKEPSRHSIFLSNHLDICTWYSLADPDNRGGHIVSVSCTNIVLYKYIKIKNA